MDRIFLKTVHFTGDHPLMQKIREVTGGYDYEPTIGEERIPCGSFIKVNSGDGWISGRFEWHPGDDEFTVEDHQGKIWPFPWGIEGQIEKENDHA